jgi:hypothetical protein
LVYMFFLFSFRVFLEICGCGRTKQKGRSGWKPGGLWSDWTELASSESHGAAGSDAYLRAVRPG